MKLPASFYKPLSIGAPAPFQELPLALERMIHFFPAHNEKVHAKIPDLIPQVDVILGNLEDAIPADAKEAARAGFIKVARENEFRNTGLWTRVNALNSPWALDDIIEIVSAVGDKLDVIMLPKVEGVWDIHYADQLLAQLEARHGIKNTRVGGGHPSYGVIEDPKEDGSARVFAQQDLWHYTVARMVDACLSNGIRPFYGPFGDIQDTDACEVQFRNSFLLGCVGAWSLHPAQIDIAKKVFSPDVDEVKFALRILEAMPDGTGAVMLDGKMQDDATWKQAKVIVDLAKRVAERDPELGKAYGL